MPAWRAGVATVALLLVADVAAAGRTTRVSVASGGAQAVWGQNLGFGISADGGRVAFDGAGSGLVPGDSGGRVGVYLHDRAGTTRRVSLRPGGAEPNANCFDPAISGDGRAVAFACDAEHPSGIRDVYVRDVEAGVTVLVSVANDGTPGNGHSGSLTAGGGVSISGNGRRVAFESRASNLVPDDDNGRADVFVRDLDAGTITRCVLEVPAPESYDSYLPALSADGRFVAIEVRAPFGGVGVWICDVESGVTRVVRSGAGTFAVANPSISGDGSRVAFEGWRPSGMPTVFVLDRGSGTTWDAAVASDGTLSDRSSAHPALSVDGRWVAFESQATNLVPGDGNDSADVFLHDLETGTTRRTTVASDGAEADAYSARAAISGRGETVAYWSAATNLVPSDTNDVPDLFVHEALATLSVTRVGDGVGRVTSDVPGIDCGADCEEAYDTEAVVRLIATPDGPGSAFVGFGGDPDCVDGTVTLDGSKACTATFALTVRLQLAVVPAFAGRARADALGLECGDLCSRTVAAGTRTTLTATPSDGWRLVRWAGDADCVDGEVTVSVETVCVAEFQERPPEPPPPLLSLVVEPALAGTARAEAIDLECRDRCTRAVTVGTRTAIVATASDGWTFAGWGGGADCADGEVTVAVDTVCVARFDERPPDAPPPLLTLVVDPRLAGTVRAGAVDLECDDRCTRAVAAGTATSITATAADGWVFLRWGGDEDCGDGEVVLDADRTCVGRFAALDRLVEVRLVVPARRLRVGRRFRVTLVARNLGSEPFSITPPPGLTALDGAQPDLSKAPVARPLRLRPRGIRRWVYRYRAAAAGTLRLTARVETERGVSEAASARVLDVR